MVARSAKLNLVATYPTLSYYEFVAETYALYTTAINANPNLCGRQTLRRTIAKHDPENLCRMRLSYTRGDGFEIGIVSPEP
jgi:hypothetical protein